MKKLLIPLFLLTNISFSHADPAVEGEPGSESFESCHHLEKIANRKLNSRPLTGYARFGATSTPVGLVTAGLLDQDRGVVPWQDLLLVDSVVNLLLPGHTKDLNHIGDNCLVDHMIVWYWIEESTIFLGYSVETHGHLLYFNSASLQEDFDEQLFLTDFDERASGIILLKVLKSPKLFEIRSPRQVSFELSQLLSESPHIRDYVQHGAAPSIVGDELLDGSIQIRFPVMRQQVVGGREGADNGDR